MQEQFSFYERNAVELKEKLGNLEEHIENAAERVKKAHSELSSEQKSSKNQKFSNVAIITVEAEKESKVEMEVVYHVHNASWSPCHDFRVNDSKPSIDITYYGKVNQNTGEDWVNAPLVLSTAKPSLMTGIPKLGTLDASLRRSPKNRTPQEIYNLHMSRVHNGGSYGPMNAFRPLSASPDSDCEEMEVAVVMYHKASEVTQNTLSAEFKISRAASILNRTDNHKVTIGIINLLPKLIHETVPSKNAAAFLTASAINTSEFEILAGEASVFLNDAFITKTKLDTISPGEEFFCSLGVDAAIRVEYKPAKKYHEEAGYINKHSANVTEQVILVKNTRLETPVFLTIKHHVPKSTDEKIRVKLIAPDATEYDPKMDTAELNEEQVERARLNAAHNLEWTVKINGGEQRELLIKWVIEHPTDATVQFSETL